MTGVEECEFYNVGGYEDLPGYTSKCMVRVPAKVRKFLNDRAKFVARDSVGCEVRFVCESPNIDIYVSCASPENSGTGRLLVYRGNFICNTFEVVGGRVNNFRLNPPAPLSEVPADVLQGKGFAPEVIRLVFDRVPNAVVHGIDTHGYGLKKPTAEQKPAINWLAYGSSITNSDLNGYPHVAARKLKVQVQNKGMSGACHCEKEMVDFLVEECAWDFATCEMGINMRGTFTVEEFSKRASYLVERFGATGKPVVIISIFPNCRSVGFGSDTESEPYLKEKDFNASLEKIVSGCGYENVQLVHGKDVLDDFAGLSGDLLHPCTFGHGVMGHNLAAILQGVLDKAGLLK